MKIQIENLVKRFHDQTAVNDFSLEIPSGELVALLGPSGCGKSTLLNMLSGILLPNDGKILFDGEDVTQMPSEKRGIGLVFQNYALYPHMTVLENICFPLEIKKVPKKIRIEKAAAIAKMVHIDMLLNRKPGQLSGGQQQRVAIARALVKQPRLLLLDEPLSNLDARLRIEMREEIRKIQQETGVTTIFVTHDQEEAMSISDRVVLMKTGVLQQYDEPQKLYDEPANCFTADFLGTPPINKLTAEVYEGCLTFDGQLSRFPVNYPDEKKVTLSFRPESVELTAQGEGIFDAEVLMTSVMGKERITALKLANTEIRCYTGSDAAYTQGQKVGIELKDKGVFLFDTASGERLT